MTGALHANSAFYKTEEGPRTRDQIIADMRENIIDSTMLLYSGKSEEEQEIDELDDPFFQAINPEHFKANFDQMKEAE